MVATERYDYLCRYLKPYACNAVLFKRNPPLETTGRSSSKPILNWSVPLDSAPLASPPTNLTHLDADSRLLMIRDDQAENVRGSSS